MSGCRVMRVVLGGTESVSRLSEMNGLLFEVRSFTNKALSKLLLTETIALIGVVISSSKNDLKSLPLLMNGIRYRLSNCSASFYLIVLSYSVSSSIPESSNWQSQTST